MQNFLIAPSGEETLISAAPRTRTEAIGLILQHAPWPIAPGTFRIVTIDVFNVSLAESCQAEVFSVALRYYEGGQWGLVEASVAANRKGSDFFPTAVDVQLWLKTLRRCWPENNADFSCTLEQVDDFHALQFFDGERLLSSVTWNAPDNDIAYRMPDTLELPERRWGDAILADITQLYEAVRALNLLSFRK
jgi:hypothetical protein